MRTKDPASAERIKTQLLEFSSRVPLLGIKSEEALDCFVKQIVDSIRRVKYVTSIKHREMSEAVADPTSEAFDPLKASVWFKQQGNINEAFWLIFLSIHFGKNGKTGWRLVQDIYGRLGGNLMWTWNQVSTNLEGFRSWLETNQYLLKETGKFGNHRKYESLNGYRLSGTGEAVASYINWVGPNMDHVKMIAKIMSELESSSSKISPRDVFAKMYDSMHQVRRFGRTAKFDYLTMLGKTGLLDIEPGSTYMDGATGPLRGARLLFAGDIDAPITKEKLTGKIAELEAHLSLFYGMQVLEDAMCNWQKSPKEYKYFRG